MQKNSFILRPDMNDRLSYYFEDEQRLKELTIAELEEQIKSVPFNQAIHLLLAKKRNQEGILASLPAFISNDRLQLKNFMDDKTQLPFLSNDSELDKEFSVSEEAKNSLQDIESFEPINPAKASEMDLELEDEQDFAASAEEINFSDSHLEDDSSIFSAAEDIQHLQTTDLNSEMEEGLIFYPDTEIRIEEEQDHEKTEHKYKPAKKKKSKQKKAEKKSDLFKLKDYSGTSDYVHWLLMISGKEVEKPVKQKKKKKKKIIETAKKSITKSAQIISESLADILALQGHISEAVKMYDQLILKFPEKSSYFAAKIDNLLKNKE